MTFSLVGTIFHPLALPLLTTAGGTATRGTASSSSSADTSSPLALRSAAFAANSSLLGVTGAGAGAGVGRRGGVRVGRGVAARIIDT